MKDTGHVMEKLTLIFFDFLCFFLSHSHKLIYALHKIYTRPVSIHFPMKTKKCTSILKTEYNTDQPVQRISIKIATNVAQKERIKCRDFGVQRSKVKVTVQCR